MSANLSKELRLEKLHPGTIKCLSSIGVMTVGDLIEKTVKEILKIRFIGNRDLLLIRRYLAGQGLHLKDDNDPTRFGAGVCSVNDQGNVGLNFDLKVSENEIVKMKGYVKIPDLSPGTRVLVTIEILEKSTT